jgi:hypothetical protein
MRRLTGLAVVAAALLLLLLPRSAAAAERFIDRPMTQHRLVFAGDVGIGVGHLGAAPNSVTGAGLNLEGALGITESVELGLRTGGRFGRDGRLTRADGYGRTLWTETYGTGVSDFANPEFRVRWVFYTGSIAEVGLDGRMVLPFEANTNLGLVVGVPVALHVTDILRIDTGAYVPLLFDNPTFNGISIPGYFWFQPGNRLWLGPMSALRFLGNGGGAHDAHLLLGFGLGVQVANAVDLKTWLLFPTIDDNPSRNYGAGFGVQFRIGD